MDCIRPVDRLQAYTADRIDGTETNNGLTESLSGALTMQSHLTGGRGARIESSAVWAIFNIINEVRILQRARLHPVIKAN